MNYEPGNIYCADALDFLKALPDASVDAVITDPPYGLGNTTFEVHRDFRRTDNGKLRGGTYSTITEAWDKEAPTQWMSHCQRVLKPGGSVICFAGMVSAFAFGSEGLRLGWKLVNDVTWIKNNPPPNFTGRAMTYSTERILWFCPNGTQWVYNTDYARSVNAGVNFTDVWHFGIDRTERLHPSQKPLALIERLISLFTRPGELVLDPFMGSGTTAIAALNTGRQFIGCDITPEYVAIARNRIAAWQGIEKVYADGSKQMGLFSEVTE